MPSTSTATTQSLSVLLPSFAQATYPRKLTSLSDSLIAQSRQRAAHLKPDEEIARAHACCEIACRRLRAPLRLPAVKEGGAPCKPAVYKRLLKFLDGLLVENDGGANKQQQQQGVKRGRDGREIQQGSQSGVEVVIESSSSTSRKRARDSNARGPSAFVGKVKNINAAKAKEGQIEAPDWVMPTIRTLCKTFGTKLMAPHVYTGTCIVLSLAGLWPRGLNDDDDDEENNDPDDTTFNTNVTNLVVALYLMVLTRMQTGKLTPKIYRSTSSRAVEVLESASGTSEIEKWIRTINRENYCKGQEWWDSVPEDVFDFDSDAADGKHPVVVDSEDDDGDNNDDDDRALGHSAVTYSTSRRILDNVEEDPDGVLLPGLGTMMQDAVDWTSEERTLDFERWKKKLLKEMGAKAVKSGRTVAVR